MTRHRTGRAGLTLIETVVVLFVFSLLTLVVTQLLIGGIKAWRKGANRADLRANARKAVDEVATDFRQAVPGSVATPAISTTISNKLQFQRYVYNGAPPASPTTTTITYFINGANCTLTRDDSASGTITIADNVLLNDPRAGGAQVSFFQWADPSTVTGIPTGATSYGNTTMTVQISTVSDAITLTTATDQANREAFMVVSAAYMMPASLIPPAETPVTSKSAIGASPYTAGDLVDPRGSLPFRLLSGDQLY